jgi:hypothetical protein
MFVLNKKEMFNEPDQQLKTQERFWLLASQPKKHPDSGQGAVTVYTPLQDSDHKTHHCNMVSGA